MSNTGAVIQLGTWSPCSQERHQAAGMPFTCAVPDVPHVNFGTTLDPMATSVLAGISSPGKWGAGWEHLWAAEGTEHVHSVT